jgi:hypothetical protein
VHPAALRRRGAPPIGTTRRVAVASSVLEFSGDDPAADSAVAALWHAAEPTADGPTHHYRLTSEADGWYGRAPQVPPFGPADLGDAWAFLEWRATEDVIAAERADAFLHAAGARIGGRHVLLVGGPGSGKSSLAAQLLDRGHSVWGDDLVRFLVSERRFGAVPRSFKLDAKALSDLSLIAVRVAAGAPGTVLASAYWYVSPAAVRAAWSAGPGRPDAIVLLDAARHGGAAELRRVGEGVPAVRASTAVLGLADGTTARASSLMVGVLEAVSEAAAYEADGGPPAALAELLEREMHG